jgi:hypothetical protein
LMWVRALVTGIRHFFMILCVLCDSEVLFRNYHVFEYSATNINRRDAEFAETWKFTLGAVAK